MKRILEALKFGYKAYQFWMFSEDNAVWYFAAVRHGVPIATIILARGREAWRVSNLAVEVLPLERFPM